MKVLSSAIAALLLVSSSAHAELHKWVDAEGNVHYSDTAPPDVKSEEVRSHLGKGQQEAPATYSPKSYVERDAELKKSRAEKEEAAQKKAQQATEAEARKHNCELARQNARALEEGTRIVTYDENGERSYLGDEARAQRLEEARKAISANCD